MPRFFKNPWWVVLGSVLGLIVGNGPITLFAFGVFLKPISEEFGWKRGTVSSAVTVGLTLCAIGTPLVGKLIDRWGIRRVTLPLIVAFALSIAAISRTPASLPVFVLLYAICGLAGSGQAVVPYAKAISGWFDARRGLALGVAMAGIGIGAALLPTLAQFVIGRSGWRSAYLALALVTFCLAFPAVALFVREPDELSNSARHALVTSAGIGEPPGMTLREAASGSALWLICIAVFLVGMAVNGTITHIVPILTDRGIPARIATSALSLSGLSLIGGRVLSGYLLDRFFAPYVAATFFLVPLAGVTALSTGWGGITLLAGAVCLGMGVGAEIDIMAFLVGKYLGLRTFGEIYGYLVGIFTFASGLGPWIMSVCFDATGSYKLAFGVAGFSLALASLLISRLGPYAYPAGRVAQMAEASPVVWKP